MILPATHPETVARPYQPGLIPARSIHRPHCPCEDRLRLWIPSPPSAPAGLGYTLSSPDAAARLLDLMSHAWAPGTKRCYGTGLLVFHVFCDNKNPPLAEHLRGPVSESLILEFIASCAGSFAGTALTNYAYGVKAWHTIHGMPWACEKMRFKAALDAAERLAPPASKRPPRPPLLLESMTRMRDHFDLNVPLDAAVFACLTTTFWASARLGEFTVPSLRGFKPGIHITPANVIFNVSGADNLPSASFHIPWTKIGKSAGEDAHWAPQLGVCDPAAALRNHFIVNKPSMDFHLFAYRHSDGSWRPLSRNIFIRRVNLAAAASGHSPVQGHSIRIGSVLEYLLRGVPFEVVKVQGRWSSDAFLRYLRRYADILSPYLQNTPILDSFIRWTMPRRI
ncbi:hypothetical protein BDZ97DRAFT_1675139 [Flammula alnicola]|nr:hypothetical protein BDZ97DRAFT_1675139 [Flammula alnicola]